MNVDDGAEEPPSTRGLMWRLRCGFLVLSAGLVAARASDVALPPPPASVEQWGLFELALAGPDEGNPFVDVRLSATFTDGTTEKTVDGFYDGAGVYRVRFMPDRTGVWRYLTNSNRWPLTGQTGAFTVTAPGPGNHGPVSVRHTYHFAYADGTPFRQLGTTSYTWTHRPEALEEQTLRTLAASPFNKLRMCVFPQSHGARTMPPPRWPFVGAPGAFDTTRFNPEFFQHLEKRIGQLRDLGLECDLILFHPYGDQAWGLDTLDRATDERYLRYLIARLAAYRNIWWSLANEYDFLTTKSDADWDHFGQVVQAADPYGHLRSIHNGFRLYHHGQAWVTHASIQNGAAVNDAGRAEIYRDVWRKPVVFDEVKYEGNSPFRWGDLSGQELVHRFWSGTVAGTYVGHSEFFGEPHDVVWLGQGGVLKGESPARLAFLRQVMERGPAAGIEPIEQWTDPYARHDAPVGDGLAEPHVGGQPGEYYLVYFGRSAPKTWAIELPSRGLADGMRFHAEVLDTWAMTVTPLEPVFTLRRRQGPRDRFEAPFIESSGAAIPLPGKPYLALRLTRVR